MPRTLLLLPLLLLHALSSIDCLDLHAATCLGTCKFALHGMELCPCDSCVPLYAVYDAHGNLIGDLCASSPDMLISLPLPVYMCWAQLLLSAAKLGQWAVAKRAAAVLFPIFIQQSPSRPLWEAHPMDSLQLIQHQVDQAALPLLRLFVQGMYVHACNSSQSLGWQSADGGKTTFKGVLQCMNTPHLEEQVALLKNCKRVLMAMQVRCSWRHHHSWL